MGKRRKGSSPGYEEALQRAADRTEEQLEDILREIADATLRFAEIIATHTPERRELIQTEPRFHTLKVCELFQAQSREAWFKDPAAAVEYAELAVATADRLTPPLPWNCPGDS